MNPNILGHGQLLTPDVGATACGVLAGYLFCWWLKRPNWSTALAAGVALGLAELTKFTWIVLFPLWPMLWVFWRWGEPRLAAYWGALAERPVSPAARERDPMERHGGRSRQGVQLAAILLLGLFVINLGYGFEGSFTRLGDFRFVTTALGGPLKAEHEASQGRNRFTGTWLGAVPVPVPRNYVLGIDVQKWDFERKYWSYLRGEWRYGGWWYYYLYGLAIKVPLGTWGLILLALFYSLWNAARGSLAFNSVAPSGPVVGTAERHRGRSLQKDSAMDHGSILRPATWRDEVVLLAPAIVVLALVSSQTGFNHHMRYVLPIFPFVFIWASKVARSFEKKEWKVAALAGAAILWSTGSSLYFYPHGLSYFNELVGGPKGGHAHLANSNTDWGQDLHYLSRWLDKHPEVSPLGLAYDVALIDPQIAGIEFSKPPIAPIPGWYAISVNKLRDHTQEYAYFLHFEPVAMAGYSIYIYHISPEEANRVRREMGLSELPSSELGDELTGDAQ